MHNTLTCTSCNEENPFYALICKKCKAYLRDRIYNIDLWNILSLLIESPSKAFKLIIQSEHKNFIIFIVILASARLFIDSMFISVLTGAPEPNRTDVILNYLVVLASVFVILILFGLIINNVNKANGLKTRFRDNFAILGYSLLPHIFSFIILFTVEASVFGTNLFSKNPSIFSLKEGLAYTLLVFEILIVLWAIFLSITAMYVQSKNKTYSVAVGIVFNLALFFCLYINSRILY